MIVMDASVLIALLDPGNAHHEEADTLLVALIGDDLGANQITLAEVLVGPFRTHRLEWVREQLDQLELTELALPSDAAVRLAILRVQTGLKMPDCCVLLSAIERDGSVASFDHRLRGVARDQGLSVVPAA